MSYYSQTDPIVRIAFCELPSRIASIYYRRPQSIMPAVCVREFAASILCSAFSAASCSPMCTCGYFYREYVFSALSRRTFSPSASVLGFSRVEQHDTRRGPFRLVAERTRSIVSIRSIARSMSCGRHATHTRRPRFTPMRQCRFSQ